MELRKLHFIPREAILELVEFTEMCIPDRDEEEWIRMSEREKAELIYCYRMGETRICPIDSILRRACKLHWKNREDKIIRLFNALKIAPQPFIRWHVDRQGRPALIAYDRKIVDELKELYPDKFKQCEEVV